MAYPPPPAPPLPAGSSPAPIRWYRKPGPVFLVVLMVACAVAIPLMLVLLGGDDGGGGAGTSTAAEFTTMAGPATVVTATTSPDQATTTAAPPTSTVPVQTEYQADVAAIQALWQGFSASWSGGLQAGAEYIAAHNYPGFPCSAEDWQAYYRDDLGWQDGDGEEVTVRAGTIERQDDWGWVVPAGYPNAGERPQGRIYVMSVDSTTRAAGTTESHTWNIHATVIGSAAYFFFECE